MTISKVGPLNPDEIRSLDGLCILRGMIAGRFPSPPMAETLNFHLAEADKGRALFKGTPGAAFLNPHGAVHGGWAAAVLDSALGCAVQSVMAPGERYTTIEFKVNLLRAITPATGLVTCEGTLVHRGRRSAVSQASMRDSGGRLLAHASETCMVFPPEG